jgi:hypothetical protein
LRAAWHHAVREPAGVEDALANLAGPKNIADDRQSAIRDTLAGDPGAKREWTEHGMITELNISAGDIDIPVTLLVGSLDKLENPERLKKIFSQAIPQTRFIEIPGVGQGRTGRRSLLSRSPARGS